MLEFLVDALEGDGDTLTDSLIGRLALPGIGANPGLFEAFRPG
jgi:hypothetical protein